MSKFSFRRSEKKAFKHIAHGLIPAATIAPRPAVPRTPPPRSPYPSPERPRSALAAAILSSSLTGRTIALPPARPRSFSESDRSLSETHATFQPYASTALYTRDGWPESLAGRPRLPSPGLSEDHDDDDEEEDVERSVLSDEDGHVYQSLDRQGRSPTRDRYDVYARPVKQSDVLSEGKEETDDSAFDIVSPLPPEEAEIQRSPVQKATSPKLEQRPSSRRSMPSPDLTEEIFPASKKRSSAQKIKSSGSRRDGPSEASSAYREVLDMQKEMVRSLTEQNQALGADRRLLEQRCTEQSLQLQRSHQRVQSLERDLSKAPVPTAGEQAELLSLRQQGQELVDENDRLKMTVHRLNVELSRYQTRFRPLGKEESSRTHGLPLKGSAPPWLLDMKYLSPLLLAYEDQLAEKDALLQASEEELRRFRGRVEEVVQENQKLHQDLKQTGGVNHKEWRQLQDQARLVLQENQLLIEQLEVQHTKAKESHGRHLTEVSKLCKQLMLLEAEKQKLEGELEVTRRELHTLQTEHLQARCSLENAVSWDEHHAIATKLKRQLEADSGRQQTELEDLQQKVTSLQTEKNSLLLDKTNLTADIRNLEAGLEASRHANRKAQQRIGLLKQQVDDSIEKEMRAHHYLSSIVALAEKTTQERDQLVYMASSLEHDKQGVISRIVDDTVRLGKLQEKVKMYKKQAACSLGVLGQRLVEQEEDFAGRAASYQTEIQHLQRLLGDKQQDLDGVLQQKREVEGELEVVWEAATRENQRIRETLQDSSPSLPSLSPARVHHGKGLSDGPSPSWLSHPQDEVFYPRPHPDSSGPPPCVSSPQSGGRPGLHHSPMFESDSDQHQNPSSDESEKNGMDFYS
ncbi:centrosomal protein of 89 kDa isoform X1 [Salmo salar]|uniref:Centrosomal protein of 89 kDa isoform X1 n=1 Tax=Salmo salar TaxID=8030 RepID=A0ABM3CGP9_SALSA|nr:centrosomal protein of 89 kDa-like isoform X1 [Salmo salar]